MGGRGGATLAEKKEEQGEEEEEEEEEGRWRCAGDRKNDVIVKEGERAAGNVKISFI